MDQLQNWYGPFSSILAILLLQMLSGPAVPAGHPVLAEYS